MKKWWITGIFVILLGIPLANAARSSTPSSRDLLLAAKGSDRIVVMPTRNVSGEGRPILPSFEIHGEEAVIDLLNQIDIVPPKVTNYGIMLSVENFACMCDGDFHIQAYRGEKLLVSIGYHHGKTIRWRKGRWGTDVYLTNASTKAVPAWLQEHGYPTMREWYEQTGR
jgi:hypothetical protein